MDCVLSSEWVYGKVRAAWRDKTDENVDDSFIDVVAQSVLGLATSSVYASAMIDKIFAAVKCEVEPPTGDGYHSHSFWSSESRTVDTVEAMELAKDRKRLVGILGEP